jgi:hypothetical protein
VAAWNVRPKMRLPNGFVTVSSSAPPQAAHAMIAAVSSEWRAAFIRIMA